MEVIVNRGYIAVDTVNQYNTALRALGLAKNLVGSGDFLTNQSYIEEAIQNYASTTHMHGVSGTLIFSAYSFCAEFLKSKDEDLRNHALQDLEYAAIIAKTTDDRTILSRLSLAKRYIGRKLRIKVGFCIKQATIQFRNV
jgi:hypothetical protein